MPEKFNRLEEKFSVLSSLFSEVDLTTARTGKRS